MSAITQVFDQVKDDAQDFANWMTSQAENLTLRNSDIVKTRHWLASQLNDPAAHYLKSEIDAAHYLKSEIDAAHYTKSEIDARDFARQDTGWLVPTLLNGWLPYGGPYGVNGAEYRKHPDGLVVVAGLVSGGTIGYTTPIFMLPVGFRPLNELIISVFSNGAAGRLNVKPDGSVMPTDGSTAWFPVCFSFYAE